MNCSPRQRPGRFRASALVRVSASALAFGSLIVGSGTGTAATIRFAHTNAVGVADTNWFLVIPVDDAIQANGGVITKGPAVRLTPNAAGMVTNNFEVGNYLVTNRFLARGYLFRAPDDHGPTVYCASCGTNNTPQGTGLAISGLNTFVTIHYGTNPPPTYDEITNSLGYVPVRAVAAGTGISVATNAGVYTVTATGQGGAATNVIDVEAGTAILVSTNQLLRTVSTTAVRTNETRAVQLHGTFTGNGAGLTNLPGPFNYVTVDVTNGNDTIGNPFKTLNAAQAAMSTGGSNYCLIHKGTYLTGTLYKTNCTFEMQPGAVLGVNTTIAVTNGVFKIIGSEFTEIRTDAWIMTNATFVANGIDLFALNSSKTTGQFYGTNTIQLKNCYIIYTGVDGLTNGLVEIIDADIVAQIGVVQTSNTVVDVSCDRIDGFGVANVLDAQGGAKVYIRANVAAVRDEIQISPNLKATQCYLTANVFTWNYNETCYHNGGVTPNTDLSDINLDAGEWQNQRCNLGFWTVDQLVTIPSIPRTRYYDSLGF